LLVAEKVQCVVLLMSVFLTSGIIFGIELG